MTFELSRDLRLIKREVYSIMDWLGNIGGLTGSLYGLFGAAVMVFEYQSMFTELTRDAYLIGQNEDRNQGRKPRRV